MTLATCPKCNGSKRIPPWDGLRKHLPSIAGYDPATDTLPCDNCGGQTMMGDAKGQTRVNPATGLGCLHTYASKYAGRCWTVYTCTKCGDRYDIDSSD